MARRRLRVGVSACLLGAEVRWDGGHKRHPFVAGRLADLVELVPVCPEVEIGLGVPRETLRLEAANGDVRLVATESGRDHTARMNRFAAARVRALAALDLDGYVLKARSPSCGLAGVPLHEPNGRASRTGRGLFAAALVTGLPRLPVEEESGLSDPRRRARFLARLRAYRRAKLRESVRATRTEHASRAPSSARKSPQE